MAQTSLEADEASTDVNIVQAAHRIKEIAAYFTPGYLRTYGIIAVGLGATYVVIRTGYSTAAFFSSVTLWDGLKVGFILGCFTGASVLGVLMMCSS
eukprot:850096-Amorphochlora_amoeboformis.AAC.1